MKFISLMLVCLLLSSCAMRVHVCFETDTVSTCDNCKKKPVVAYRPQDERIDKTIQIIGKSFICERES